MGMGGAPDFLVLDLSFFSEVSRVRDGGLRVEFEGEPFDLGVVVGFDGREREEEGWWLGLDEDEAKISSIEQVGSAVCDDVGLVEG